MARSHWTRAGIEALRSLVRFHPSPVRRWPLALQASLAIAVPIAAATIAGEPRVGFQASAGAFIVIFGSQLPTVERAKLLPVLGAGLYLCAALGLLAAWSEVTLLVGLFAVTVASAAGVYGRSLGAPGPVFFVLVYGLSAQVGSAGSPTGAVTLLLALLAGLVIAYLIALAPLVRRQGRRIRARPLARIAPATALRGPVGALFARAVAVCAAGVAIGAVVDPHRAYWIVGAGIAVIGVATRRQLALNRGIHRVIGTLAGAGIFLLLTLLHPSGLWLALLMGVLQFAVEIFVVRNYALALAFITPLVLLLTSAATGQVDASVVWARIVDTLIGAALGAASGLAHARSDGERAGPPPR
ncbi:FUSC family protein [Microbacterium sp. BWT-B31]|uniref:FUSC family protein n=1 Tax=Microbacterium sp. BWT-B31 TaxID=3232072 RepID=UPI0035274E3C